MELSFDWKKNILDEKHTTALPMDMILASDFSFSIIQQSLPQGLSNNEL